MTSFSTNYIDEIRINAPLLISSNILTNIGENACRNLGIVKKEMK